MVAVPPRGKKTLWARRFFLGRGQQRLEAHGALRGAGAALTLPVARAHQQHAVTPARATCTPPRHPWVPSSSGAGSALRASDPVPGPGAPPGDAGGPKFAPRGITRGTQGWQGALSSGLASPLSAVPSFWGQFAAFWGWAVLGGLTPQPPAPRVFGGASSGHRHPHGFQPSPRPCQQLRAPLLSPPATGGDMGRLGTPGGLSLGTKMSTPNAPPPRHLMFFVVVSLQLLLFPIPSGPPAEVSAGTAPIPNPAPMGTPSLPPSQPLLGVILGQLPPLWGCGHPRDGCVGAGRVRAETTPSSLSYVCVSLPPRRLFFFPFYPPPSLSSCSLISC